MLSCMIACTMRSTGVSEDECLGHCDRHGQSGCRLTVNEETFKLCGPRDIRGSECAGPVSQSDCELGCHSYPQVQSRYERRELPCSNVNLIANPGRLSTFEDCQAACDDRDDCGAIQINTRSRHPANNCLLYSNECNENRVDLPCTSIKECFYFERVFEATSCTLSGGEHVFDGWSGNDSGENSCNTCSCESGTLMCTEMACRTTADASIFSTESADCIKGVFDIGQVFGRAAHTIHVKLDMPEFSAPRQWILNLGQEGTGANHWIWSGARIQFGPWNGRQISQVDINPCTDLTTTFDGENTLTLYCNGEFLGQVENSNLNIRNSNLAVAGNQGYEVPRGNFRGCVHYVEVWDYDLSSTEVASLTNVVNIVEENAPGVGGWGGSCTCPDGSVYQVGDNIDFCDSLACIGGVSGTCNRRHGEWSRRKVTCGAQSAPTGPSPGPSPHELLKMKVKAAFDVVKSPEEKNALPGLIRKAFHDAGHFDKTEREARMGCIQHFLAGENFCPQHGHLEEATRVVEDVMAEVDMELSMADAVQLLGALAVDELAKGTGAAPLYDRVRTGRIDPAADPCIGKKLMCNILPAASTTGHSTDHQSIVDGLEDVFESEIRGKMIGVNSFSKQDAVALIGAHTVGRHFLFGHWTQQPFIFDNEYFVQLNRVKDWIDQGNTFGEGEEEGRPFGQRVFNDWVWILRRFKI